MSSRFCCYSAPLVCSMTLILVVFCFSCCHAKQVTRVDDEGNGPPEFMCHMWMRQRPPPCTEHRTSKRYNRASKLEHRKSMKLDEHGNVRKSNIGNFGGYCLLRSDVFITVAHCWGRNPPTSLSVERARKATSNQTRTTSNNQRATSNEQRNNKPPANEQRAT